MSFPKVVVSFSTLTRSAGACWSGASVLRGMSCSIGVCEGFILLADAHFGARGATGSSRFALTTNDPEVRKGSCGSRHVDVADAE